MKTSQRTGIHKKSQMVIILDWKSTLIEINKRLRGNLTQQKRYLVKQKLGQEEVLKLKDT